MRNILRAGIWKRGRIYLLPTVCIIYVIVLYNIMILRKLY